MRGHALFSGRLLSKMPFFPKSMNKFKVSPQKIPVRLSMQLGKLTCVFTWPHTHTNSQGKCAMTRLCGETSGTRQSVQSLCDDNSVVLAPKYRSTEQTRNSTNKPNQIENSSVELESLFTEWFVDNWTVNWKKIRDTIYPRINSKWTRENRMMQKLEENTNSSITSMQQKNNFNSKFQKQQMINKSGYIKINFCVAKKIT